MLKRILSLVLNSKKEEEAHHPVATRPDSPWVDCGGDPNDWMQGMISDAKKRKAKQIDDYIFNEYEE
tara:strand:- start:843 stop:1043 length:201 start_codon:yes stop_codon:yes gene_type:complete